MNRKAFSIPSAITCVLLVIVCAFIWVYMQNSSPNAENVVIYRDSECIATLPLYEDTELTIEDIGMIIAVEDGAAFVKESSCRCKTCQNFGRLSKAGQTAVCLPYNVRIEVSGNSDIDAVL